MSFTHAVAAPVEVEIDGGKYMLPPVTLGHLSTIAEFMRARLVDNVTPALAAAQSLGDASLTAIVVREALKEQREQLNTIQPEAALHYALTTSLGLSFALWILLQERHGDKFTHDDLYRIVRKLESENLSAAFRLASRVAMAAGHDKSAVEYEALGNREAARLAQAAAANAGQTGTESSGISVSPSKPAATDSTPAPLPG